MLPVLLIGSAVVSLIEGYAAAGQCFSLLKLQFAVRVKPERRFQTANLR